MKRHVTPSMVVAMIALAVALSGGAVAASNGLILGSSIKDHTVSASKLTPNALRFLHGKQGDQGIEGAQGVVGPPGPNGSAGAAGGFDPNKVSYVLGAVSSMASNTVLGFQAFCPSGTKAIGGGGQGSIGKLSVSEAGGGGAYWFIIVYNDTSITIDNVGAFAVCASP